MVKWARIADKKPKALLQFPSINRLGEETLHYNNKEKAAIVTNALSTMLRLLGEELEAASWLMEARSRMDPIEPCDEEW